jgi:hypothetical protein
MNVTATMTTTMTGNLFRPQDKAIEGDEEDVGEEKKSRRREQIALSARRHRSRVKEELISLRKQVHLLQCKMELLRLKHKSDHPSGNDFTEWEEKALTQRRKRKKAEDVNVMLRGLMQDQAAFTSNVRDMVIKSPLIAVSSTSPNLMDGHCGRSFHCLGSDEASRMATLLHIADKRMELAYEFVMHETQACTSMPGHLDIKLNGIGKNINVKLIRVCEFDGVDHHEVLRALIQSFLHDPKTFQMVNANTRYGLVSMPVFIERTKYAMESLFVVRHKANEDIGVVSWDSVAQDDLHPVPDALTIRNEEVGR